MRNDSQIVTCRIQSPMWCLTFLAIISVGKYNY